jgi:hypothetical protein
MAAGAASGAAAAAAAAAEAARQEEEEMTPYSSKDLAENWEFKILRSVTNKFRDPVSLHAVLQEEVRAGWSLVEKFDDTRVRLKRPAGARAKDAGVGFDPYRTWVGMSQTRFCCRDHPRHTRGRRRRWAHCRPRRRLIAGKGLALIKVLHSQ